MKKPCKNCGASPKKMIYLKTVCPRKVFRYHIECDSCAWTTKSHLFMWLAVIDWNRRKK